HSSIQVREVLAVLEAQSHALSPKATSATNQNNDKTKAKQNLQSAAAPFTVPAARKHKAANLRIRRFLFHVLSGVSFRFSA
ncbi:MAG: hypothetical protein AAGA58_20425, partial [Verrucomicrobiota bacterium]